MAKTNAKKTAEAVAETVKATEIVKEAPVATEAKAEAPAKKATTAKKTATKKAEAPKAEEKKTAPAKKATAPKKATTAKKTATVENIYIQQGGNEVTTAVLVEKAKADSGVKAPKTVDIYVRPEINMVYYVIDGETFGNFELC